MYFLNNYRGDSMNYHGFLGLEIWREKIAVVGKIYIQNMPLIHELLPHRQKILIIISRIVILIQKGLQERNYL